MARSYTKPNISPSRSRLRQIDDNGLNSRRFKFQVTFCNPVAEADFVESAAPLSQVSRLAARGPPPRHAKRASGAPGLRRKEEDFAHIFHGPKGPFFHREL